MKRHIRFLFAIFLCSYGHTLTVENYLQIVSDLTKNRHERDANSNCQDKNPIFCTYEKFLFNPYDTYINCRKWLNNCDGCLCENSRFQFGSGGNCKTLPDRFCTVEASWHKCPLKCNRCSEIQNSGCRSCEDTSKTCSTLLCDRIPGLFYPLCKKTCNNCEGCMCVDSTSENCKLYKTTNRCSHPQAHWYCPKTCGLCDKMKKDAKCTRRFECIDDYQGDSRTGYSERCSDDQCKLRPGFFLQRCQQTCKNCDGCKCFDSINPEVPCSQFKNAGSCIDPGQWKTALFFCPLTCGKCDEFVPVNCPPSSAGRKRRNTHCETPDDEICHISSVEMCATEPGVYLNKCPNLCNNCDGLKCFDSINYVNCSIYKANNLCHDVRHNGFTSIYCPKTCDFCSRPAEPKALSWQTGNHKCVDDSDCSGVTNVDCNERPGWFMRKCKKTCDNCKSTKCFDSISFNCGVYNPLNCTENVDLFEYCPKTCGLCGK